MLGRPDGKMTVIRGAQDAAPARRAQCTVPSCLPPVPNDAGRHRPSLPGMQPETRHAPLIG